MWTEKYKPGKLEEVLGNPKAVIDLKNYRWEKPLLLYGAPGIGKTVLVEALAKETGFELAEINDDNIASGRSIVQTGSLFGARKLILFDNVDQMDNIREVAEILKVSRNPMMLITSDFDSKRLATIKKMCEKIQMKRPASVSVAKLLERICKEEGVEADKEVLKKIAENSQGDMRAAVNDLETIALARKKITVEDLSLLEERDAVSDIYKSLGTIFFRKDMQESIKSTYDLDEQPQNVLLWIDENLPGVVKGPAELGKCYEYLSKADVFLGRIMRRQYWGFLRYANPLMTAGVTVSKGEKVCFVRYQFPSYIIRMGQTKKERELKKNIGLKLSPSLHCPSKTVAGEYIPLYRSLAKAGRLDVKELGGAFKLDDEEMDYISGKV